MDDTLVQASISGGIAVVFIGWGALRKFRRRYRIAVRPRTTGPDIERLDQRTQMLFAETVQPLSAEGFVLAGTVHAPSIGCGLTYTHVLFLNRQTGERASIQAVPSDLRLTIVTEYRDAGRVLTHTIRCPGEISSVIEPRSGVRVVREFCVEGVAGAAINVQALCAAHRETTSAFVSSLWMNPGTGVLPKPGQELAWLQERPAVLTAATASHWQFHRSRHGDFFQPGWSRTVRMFINAHGVGASPQPRGFEVKTNPLPAQRKSAD